MRILIASDRPLLREGIKSSLAAFGSDLTILEACDLPSALTMAAEYPDLELVVLGVSPADKSTPRTIADLRAGKAGLGIVIVAPQVSADEVMSAFACGARGYVGETLSQQVFLHALRLVISGGLYIPKEFLASGAKLASARDANAGKALPTEIRLHAICHAGSLTPKQAQVLELMAQGKTNKLIGRELRMAPGTVKAHVSGILKALNVRNRTQAVAATGAAIDVRPLVRHTAHGTHVN